MLSVRLAGDLVVACDVFINVSVLFLLPRDVLDEIWDLIESVSEGFPTYFYSSRQNGLCQSKVLIKQLDYLSI